MSIVVNQSIPVVAAQGVTADVVLQPGSVVSARVLQILGDNQARIVIGGQSIDVQSQVPLQAGQTLQLAVSTTNDGIRLAVVTPQSGAAAGQAAGAAAGAAAPFDQVTLAPDAAIQIAAQPTLVPPTSQLTPQEAQAVSTAAQIAATQQTSLAPLFANLDVAASLAGLPPQVQQAVGQLLSQRTSLDPSLSGEDVKQAFQNSGLLLEAHLAAGSAPSATTPDLKAALIVLRQVLTTSLGGTGNAQGTPQPAVAGLPNETQPAVLVEQGAQPIIPGTSRPVTGTVAFEAPATASPTLAPGAGATATSLHSAALPLLDEVFDFSAARQIIPPAATPADAAARAAANTAGLSLLQETLQAGPQTALNAAGMIFDDGLLLSLLPSVSGTRTSRVDDAAFARTNLPPPPINGALPAAQPVMPATLVSNSPAETAMHHLLADTEGAIARQTLLQVASLPDRVETTVPRLDPTTPRWNFEIPFATPQGTAVAQFEISRDSAANEVDAAKRVWRARFSLDIEPAGPVHALISLTGDKTSVRMWAERPATAAQLRAGTAQLSQALSRAQLQPGDIVIRDGAPTQPAPAPAGHFLDRAL